MIKLVCLKKYYGGRCALEIPALTIGAGERLALIGPNGSGKSTLLRLLAGTIRPEEGAIRSTDFLRGDIGYLPQKPYAFDLSVQKNVELALWGEREKSRLAARALDSVGLLHLANERANRLSGGEMQRIALARIIARPRKLLLLDEPTASADIAAIEAIERALNVYLDQNGSTLVFSSHAPAQAGRLAERVLALDGGRIGELGDTKQVLHHPEKESTQLFLRSWKI